MPECRFNKSNATSKNELFCRVEVEVEGGRRRIEFNQRS
jgi:hypothetical protein